MRAVVHSKYGPPEVLSLQETGKPVPKDNELLIKIHATTVNRTDCGFRKAEYFIIRFFSGFFKPKRKILGSEFAGEVEATGAAVTSFKTGDAVFGMSTYRFGTHAEYICIPEKGSIAHKPVNFTYEEAAAVCDGLMLGKNLVRKKDFENHPSILVNGATGSIGSACVQLAHYYDANITAVCNTKNIELIRSLGAADIIDYSQEDFTKKDGRYDIVIDAVGKSSYFKCRKILKPGGVYMSTELGFLSQNIFLALFTPLLGGKKVKFPIPKDSKEDILFFKSLIEAGKYKAIIDRTYPLEQIIEATNYVETGEKTGNVVIRITEKSTER